MSKEHDYTAECRSDLEGVEESLLRRGWCVRCRQKDCVHAKFGDPLWLSRILTQEDRFLNNPNFADEDDPVYAAIRSMDFKNVARQAIRMHLSDRARDWEIPMLPDENLSVSVRAESRTIQPPPMSEDVTNNDEKKSEGPRSSNNQLKTEDPLLRTPLPTEESLVSRPQPTRPPQLPNRPNTLVPAEGIMTGGVPVPPRQWSEPPSRKSSVPTWEIPADRSIEKGRKTIRLNIRRDKNE